MNLVPADSPSDLASDLASDPAMPARPPRFPVNFDLDGASVLVVGGGRIAQRKVESLLDCGARVTVVAPQARPELVALDGVRWHEREYRRGEVASYRLAISATGDPGVDRQVFSDAQASGIPINVADVPELCTFTLPAVVRRGDLQITVSTNGRSPAFAGWVGRQLAASFDETWATAVELIGEVRDELHRTGHSTEVPGWRDAFDDGFVALVAAGDHDAARTLLRRHLGVDAAA